MSLDAGSREPRPRAQAPRVLCFGEVLWDVLVEGGSSETRVLGGAPFNLACRLTSLGEEGVIASRVGNDRMGREALSRIAEMGLSALHVQIDASRPTGTNVITFDAETPPGGRLPRHDLKREVAYDYIEATDSLLDAARSADCLNFGTLIQRSPVSRRSLERALDAGVSALKLLDLNLRAGCYTEETVLFSLENADILKLNEDEAGYLAEMLGPPAETLPSSCESAARRWDLDCVAVTLGERGACAFTPENGFCYVPGSRVKVADGEGCGDAFTAGFLHAFLGGESAASCLKLGNAFGALAATRRGATGRIDPDDIARFTGERHEPVADERLREFEAR